MTTPFGSKLDNVHIKARSERHDATIAASARLNGSSTNIDDFPVPSVLLRQFIYQNSNLSSGESLGKVIGFRVQVKGRRGSRRVKQALSFGRLNTNRLGSIEGSHVDFGRSTMFSPRQGIRSVKVWIAYGSK